MRCHVCFAVALVLLAAVPSRPAQLMVGTQPYVDAPVRVSLDLFPFALGFRRADGVAYWHGTALGAAGDRDTWYVSLAYGACFFGINSGGIFLGPVADIMRREVGLSLDISYSIVSIPVKLSLQSIGAEAASDMLFAASLSGGIGLLFPLVRMEDGRLRHLFNR
ncbi:MAG: hypothetical protein GF418_14810 [Chitinivibrionales bacterium]|nr:hypothetical protein [Chitinivibrionales bacterium]MBD3396891.1 hypothetical protein [Chitinivibrionales bacterium]